MQKMVWLFRWFIWREENRVSEENTTGKDFNDTIKFALKEFKKVMAEPEYILLPDNTKIKNTPKEIRKYIKFMKKDIKEE